MHIVFEIALDWDAKQAFLDIYCSKCGNSKRLCNWKRFDGIRHCSGTNVTVRLLCLFESHERLSYRCAKRVETVLIRPLFILQVAAQAGQKVVVVDVEQKVLDKAQNAIKISLQRVAKKQFKVLPE